MDRVKFACPACGATVTAPPSLAGCARACPKCNVTVVNWTPLTTLAFEVVPEPFALPPEPTAEPDRDEDNEPPRRRRRPEGGSDYNTFLDIITFRRMLTPVLIQIVFWLGTIVCAVAGGKIFLENLQDHVSQEKPDAKSKFDPLTSGPFPRRDEGGFGSRTSQPFGSIGLGLGLMIFGPLVIRIWCELTIILFSIQRELKIANDRHP